MDILLIIKKLNKRILYLEVASVVYVGPLYAFLFSELWLLYLF